MSTLLKNSSFDRAHANDLFLHHSNGDVSVPPKWLGPRSKTLFKVTKNRQGVCLSVQITDQSLPLKWNCADTEELLQAHYVLDVALDVLKKPLSTKNTQDILCVLILKDMVLKQKEQSKDDGFDIWSLMNNTLDLWLSKHTPHFETKHFH